MNRAPSDSIWASGVAMPEAAALRDDVETDICVAGAGIAGLMTAFLLAEAGRKVTVIEAGAIGRGETAKTTAHLASALDDGFERLETLFGVEGATLAYQSHARAIEEIERISLQEKIECEFTRLDGYLFEPEGAQGNLDREYTAARRAGVVVEWADRTPAEGLPAGQCLRFARQAQFHPLQFIAGLVKAFLHLGGAIYTGTSVVEIKGGKRPFLRTRDGRIVTAGTIVDATNVPISENVVIHTRQAPYRSYAIAAAVGWNTVERALYWDTADPYHYIRLKSSKTPSRRAGHDLLIVGGEDHRQGKDGHEADRFACLEEWARERFPIEGIEYRWSGMVLEPSDSLALIGHDNSQENVYIATGDSGHGMTHGAIAGMLLRDLIVGHPNPWAELYSPSRIQPGAAVQYVGQNLEVMADLARWITPGEVSDVSEIAPGNGAIVRAGVSKHAVYRDARGAIHRLSAVCPHLGCLVSWNNAESTWDCPCHGSRFEAEGRVIHGPATADLDRI